ncbi:MAG: PorV/PorQ family protein [Ignavibacteria bacterium]|jgi:long-subunit fatty acid transport protein|nr:PorV/PorQ family protein [Ignavibacteria bacterium]MDH7529002.1 PorV/PorQ family protein [Ignavibacteria bacterium]
MKMKILTFIVLTSFLNVFSQTKVGSTAAPFLNIGVGPRAIAMGGGFSATANDVTALYWNPAGISRTENNEAMFAHTSWFADITFNWAGAKVNLGDLGAVGLSVTYLDYGKMEVTTLREQDGTGEFFTAKDMSLALSYAYNLTDRFSIGGSVKYINQSIWNSSANAIAFDLGTLFYSEIFNMRIAATISNFGTDMQLSGKDLLVLYDIDPNIYGNNDQILANLRTDSYPLPLLFRVGVALDLLNTPMNKITVGVDALHPNDNSESLNVGAEYTFNNFLALRAGYKNLFLKNSEEGLTLGVGVKYDFYPGFGINFDYAYQDFGILKNTQHFSISVRF